MNPLPYHLSTASRPHWTEAAGTEGKTLPYPQPEGKQQKKTQKPVAQQALPDHLPYNVNSWLNLSPGTNEMSC